MKAAAIGIAYGLLLSAIGFILAGAGHGSYAFIGWVSSPFSLLGIPVAMFAPPILWGVTWYLAASNVPRYRRLALLGIVFHYASAAVLVLWPGGEYADWDYVRRSHMEGGLALCFLLYLAPQVYLWQRLWRYSP